MRLKHKRILLGLGIVVLFVFVVTVILLMQKPKSPLSFNDLETYERFEYLPIKTLHEIIDEEKSNYDTLDIVVALDNEKNQSLEDYAKAKAESLKIENKKDMIPLETDLKLLYVLSIDSGSTVEVPIEIKTKDTKAPRLSYTYNDEVYTESGDIELEDGSTPKEKISVEAKDYYFGEYTRDLTVVVSENFNQALDIGEYELLFSSADEEGNEASLSIKLDIVEKEDLAIPYVSASSSTASIIDDSLLHDELVLVNRKNALPKNFEPRLTTFASGYAVSDGYRATANVVRSYSEMADAMYEETGLWMYVTSSYRSYDYQGQLYNGYVASHGQQEADRFSAKPGTSEHQTGLAIDLVAKGGTMDDFGSSLQSDWVNQNAHKYGFIIRYKEGKEHITGYMPEPWHIRYLGVEQATKVYQSGLTYEEYLGVE